MVTEGTVALVCSETAAEETYRAPLFSFLAVFPRFSLYNKEADVSVSHHSSVHVSPWCEELDRQEREPHVLLAHWGGGRWPSF